MMSSVEARCINQGNAIYEFPSLAVFACDGIQRKIKFFYCVECTPISEPVLSIKLHRVHISARELCSLCLSFRFGLVEIAKIESMPLAANVVSDSEIYPARLSIAVDFHDRRAAFYENRESVSLHVFGA